MSDEVPDPAEEFADMDLENIEMGFTDDDLEDVVDSVRGDLFQCAGIQCRVRKAEVEETDETITKSRQKFWVAGVEVNWPEHLMQRAAQMFDAEILHYDDEGWIEVRVGHERATSREDAEDEAEWLAEQVVMLRNDPNAPV